MAPPLHKLLILDDAVLMSMAGHPNFTGEFPFLAALKRLSPEGQRKSGCTPCQRTAAARVQTINGVKRSILNLGAEQKRRLKKLLRAEQVRLYLKDGGKTVTHTF